MIRNLLQRHGTGTIRRQTAGFALHCVDCGRRVLFHDGRPWCPLDRELATVPVVERV